MNQTCQPYQCSTVGARGAEVSEKPHVGLQYSSVVGWDGVGYGEVRLINLAAIYWEEATTKIQESEDVTIVVYYTAGQVGYPPSIHKSRCRFPELSTAFEIILYFPP